MRTPRLKFNIGTKILMTLVLASFIAPRAHADEKDKRQPRVPVTAVYDSLRKDGVAEMCKANSPYSSCLYSDVASCQAGVSETLETCIKGDQKHHEDFMLTEPQQKTVASAMLTCVQQTIVSSRKDALNFKCLSENKSLADKSPYETRYMLSLAGEVQKLKAKNEEFKTNDRASCPGYQGKDSSGCFKQMLKSYKITSTAAASLLLVMGVQATIKDKAAGYDQRSGVLMMVDTELALMEQIDLSKFTINEMAASTLSEQISRRILVQAENDSLRSMKEKLLDAIAQAMDAPASSRKPASTSAWQIEKETELRLRLAKIKARPYSLK